MMPPEERRSEISGKIHVNLLPHYQITFSQVTSEVVHYFLIFKKIFELLFPHALTDSSSVPLLREIRSKMLL